MAASLMHAKKMLQAKKEDVLTPLIKQAEEGGVHCVGMHPNTTKAVLRHRRAPSGTADKVENINTAKQTEDDEAAPLIVEESSSKGKPRWNPAWDPDYDPSLPYGGKVFLPRKKKPDPTWVTVTEALVIICTIAFAIYSYFYIETVHYHVTHGYAHLGFMDAQHMVGQRLYHGKGVEQDRHLAMEWYKKAADQGHGHASYNLAVGHLQGVRTDLVAPGESHRLIHHAASKGVKEAHRALNDVCSRGGCT